MARRWPLLARISVACLALFCAAMTGATWSYAGGSWFDPRRDSHHFLENFWCDLLREPAHNGRPNGLSVLLGTLGFVALGAALAPFWLQVSRLLPRRRAAFVRGAGSAAALATALVALVPSDRSPALHGPVVVLAGGLGLVCGCICSGWALAHFRRARAFAASSLLLVTTAALNLLLYVQVAYFDAPDTVALPALQKLATFALLAWMLAGLQASGGLPAATEAATSNHPKP